MDQLQSELLLLIFKQLDLREMVKVTRVCKTWFDVINENQSPWRSLVLLDKPFVLPNRERGWNASIIEFFDRKSQSTLQTVSIRVCDLQYEQAQSIRATLERSKHSLQYLYLLDSPGRISVSSLGDLSWKLPNVVHCVIRHESDRSSTRIVQNPQSREPLSSLSALWIRSVTSIFRLHSHIMDNVVSLHVEERLSSSEWRSILEKPAQKVKDLKIKIRDGAPPRPQSSLDFPNLRVLQLGTVDERFPSWMKISSSSTFIDHWNNPLLSDLPSISTVWLRDLDNIRTLEERCPVLAELRIDSGDDQTISQNELPDKSDLFSMLRTRKKRVGNGAKVDGVKMIPLKTLVINFRCFTRDEISQLKELVQEVVDLNSVDKFIDVEI